MDLPFGVKPDKIASETGADAALQGFDQHQLQALLREGWRLTPATMAVKITDGKWLPAPHLVYTSTVISTAIRKGNQFILVSMPPRHGKSEFLSVHTPQWYLETYPQNRVILASYGAELATEFGVRVRDTFQDPDLAHLLRTRLKKDAQRADNFKTTDGGGMISIGTGGSATGKGANLFLIDDFIKNAEEALSETQKKKNWDWFLSTAFTRLEPDATIIVLATRWAQNDLIGMILEKFDELTELGFDPPTIINFPALAEESDVLGRKVGEPLWPYRYNEKALSRIKAMLGTYWWKALYQQDPPASMSGMALGECIKPCTMEDMPHPSRLKTVRAWDLAATENAGDYTAGLLVSYDKETGNTYLWGGAHEQYSPKKVEQLVKTHAEHDGEGISIWIEQEPGSAGLSLIKHYQTDVVPLHGVLGEKATGPIEVRAQPFLAAVEAGTVYYVPGKWVKPFKDELNGFPDAEHDDILVAASLGYKKVYRAAFGGVSWGRSRERRSYNPSGLRRRVGGVVW